MVTDLSAEVALGKGCGRRKEKRVSRTGGLFSAPRRRRISRRRRRPEEVGGGGAGGVWARGAVALESPREGRPVQIISGTSGCLHCASFHFVVVRAQYQEEWWILPFIQFCWHTSIHSQISATFIFWKLKQNRLTVRTRTPSKTSLFYDTK
jgi:hypothetical protein